MLCLSHYSLSPLWSYQTCLGMYDQPSSPWWLALMLLQPSPSLVSRCSHTPARTYTYLFNTHACIQYNFSKLGSYLGSFLTWLMQFWHIIYNFYIFLSKSAKVLSGQNIYFIYFIYIQKYNVNIKYSHLWTFSLNLGHFFSHWYCYYWYCFMPKSKQILTKSWIKNIKQSLHFSI